MVETEVHVVQREKNIVTSLLLCSTKSHVWHHTADTQVSFAAMKVKLITCVFPSPHVARPSSLVAKPDLPGVRFYNLYYCLCWIKFECMYVQWARGYWPGQSLISHWIIYSNIFCKVQSLFIWPFFFNCAVNYM